MLEEKNPDFILMDIGLDGSLDGIDTACRLRETKDIPIIFVTAYSNNEIFERIKCLGNYECISKPVGNDELIHCVEKVLNEEKSK